MKDEQKYANIVDMVGDFNNDKNLILQLTQQITDLEAKLAESEKQVKHWHDLYKDRDNQFQSVRQRYHLLNRLQAKYDDKNKLHLSEMQCLELVDENEKLKQQLAEKNKELTILKEIIDKNKTGKFTSENVCYAINKFYEPLLKHLQNQKAIEELEKAKEELKGVFSLSTQQQMFDKYIDQQITKLKGEK